jgi:YesN/AraC family two-component response regulator
MAKTLDKLFKKSYSAKDGAEALALVERHAPDLILTDINMPIMDGVTLIKEIRSKELDIPIIVLTAHNESNLLIELINLEVDKYINKPIEKNMMISVFYKVCRAIVNEKLVREQEEKIRDAYEESEKRNRILEQKLSELVFLQNKLDTKKRENSTPTESSTESSDYFETIRYEDREELRDLSIEVDSYTTMMFQNKRLDQDYFDKVIIAYEKFSTILNSYPLFSPIATQLYRLLYCLKDNRKVFQEKLHEVALLIESFHFTLEKFRSDIWEVKHEDPSYYDASIESDISQIIHFLEGKDIHSEMEFF